MPTGAPSSVEMVSVALSYLGESPIASFTDPSSQGILARTIYETTKREFLSDHRWRFALRESKLAQLPVHGSDNTFSFNFAYGLPKDTLYPFGLASKQRFNLSGEELYTNDSQPILVYIENVDEDFFPPWFVSAMQYELAARLAIPVTEKTERAGFFRNEADKRWIRARSKDSQTSTEINLSANVLAFLESGPTPRP